MSVCARVHAHVLCLPSLHVSVRARVCVCVYVVLAGGATASGHVTLTSHLSPPRHCPLPPFSLRACKFERVCVVWWQVKNISLTYSQVYGAVTMNNTMCLGLFLLVVWWRDLTWVFSSEVRAYVRACVRAYVRACVRAGMRACVSVSVSLCRCVSLVMLIFRKNQLTSPRTHARTHARTTHTAPGHDNDVLNLLPRHHRVNSRDLPTLLGICLPRLVSSRAGAGCLFGLRPRLAIDSRFSSFLRFAPRLVVFWVGARGRAAPGLTRLQSREGFEGRLTPFFLFYAHERFSFGVLLITCIGHGLLCMLFHRRGVGKRRVGSRAGRNGVVDNVRERIYGHVRKAFRCRRWAGTHMYPSEGVGGG